MSEWTSVIMLTLFWSVVAILFVLFMKHRGRKQEAKNEVARREWSAWQAQYEAWWREQQTLVTDPTTSQDDLVDFALKPVPSDPTLRVATLELFRVLAKNPNLPADVRTGLVSRIGAEEAAIRNDERLNKLEQSMRRSKGGGGFIVGGGFSVPLD